MLFSMSWTRQGVAAALAFVDELVFVVIGERPVGITGVVVAGDRPGALEIVADDACPNRGYFLHLLYFMVGDAVSSQLWPSNEAILRGFIERAAGYAHPDVVLWRQRALALLEAPESYDEALWRGEEKLGS